MALAEDCPGPTGQRDPNDLAQGTSPLTRPLAVEAPFLVPKSIAAAPATSESGM